MLRVLRGPELSISPMYTALQASTPPSFLLETPLATAGCSLRLYLVVVTCFQAPSLAPSLFLQVPSISWSLRLPSVLLFSVNGSIFPRLGAGQ